MKYNVGDKLRLNLGFTEQTMITFLIIAISDDDSIFGKCIDRHWTGISHIKLEYNGTDSYAFHEWDFVAE